MRRLSIIDTSRGHQPIYNENKTIVIVFNGEIYNYRELSQELREKGHHFSTHSDTETIVHLFEEYGINCVHKLRGMFCFALYDILAEKLYLVRDRIGIKPLYYSYKNGKLIFSSELKSLLNMKDISKEVHLPAIQSFLRLRYVEGPQTMFKEIHKLPPGSILTYHNHKIDISTYWNPHDYLKSSIEQNKLSSGDYFDQFSELLDQSIRLHLESDVPVGSYLSGGLDSSIITERTAAQTSYPVQSFCVGFNSEHDETIYAKEFASHINSNFNEIICTPDDIKYLPQMTWHNDEPIGDPIAIPTFLLSKYASKKVKVVVTGEGADEVLGGYLFHRVLDLANKANSVVPGILFKNLFAPAIEKTPVHLLNTIFDYPAYLGTTGRDKVSHFTKLIGTNDQKKMFEYLITLCDDKILEQLFLQPNSFKSSINSIILDQRKSISFFDTLTALQFSSWLPDNILQRQDKMSMANGLEARVPFLDHKLVEFLLGTPMKYKLNSYLGKNKILLRKYAQGHLENKISQRRKKAFYIPMEGYLQNKSYQTLVNETLSVEKIRNRGYFAHNQIENLIKSAASGRDFISAKQVFALVSLELWHQIYIDGVAWN